MNLLFVSTEAKKESFPTYNLNMRFFPFSLNRKRSVHDNTQEENEKNATAQHVVDMDHTNNDVDSSDYDSEHVAAEHQTEKKRSRWTGGVSSKNRRLVRIFGQVGFCAKGMVYG